MATIPVKRQLGLTQVWPKDGRPTTLDIVAIHGLDTASPRTWVAYEDETNHNSRLVHWLEDEDMLPYYLKNSRIFTYDWNANTRHNASTQYFHDHAVTFLQALETKRRGIFAGSRLLLIGSCYGGLVIAKAFVMALAEERFSNIHESLCGIIFLGTPFRGSRATVNGQKLALMSGMLGNQSSHALLNVIDSTIGDGRLDEFRDAFCRHATLKWGTDKHEKVICFFETEPTKILRAVLPRWFQTNVFERGIQLLTGDTYNFSLVEKSSACLDGFGHHAIDERHAMLNKYRDRGRNFERMVTCIGDIIGEPDLLNNPAELMSSTTPTGIKDRRTTLTEEEQKCHALFRVSDYEWFKDRIEERLPGTCSWFTKHPRYATWLQAHRGVLLVTAYPGCGKSVLAKSLVDYELPREATICYFFFKEMDQNTLRLALCGMLHQLFLKRPDLLTYAIREYNANGKAMIQSVSVLWRILEESCSDSAAGAVIFVLDALDECLENDLHDLSQRILRFYQDHVDGVSGLKFVLTARPYESVTGRFKPLELIFPTVSLRGEDESKIISQEINIVIKHWVEKFATRQGLSQAIRQHLENRLAAIPNQTYLWAHLVFDYLQTNIMKKTKAGVDAVIERLPETVPAAYARLLDRCQSYARPEVRRALLIIVGAFCPLSLAEFNVAVSTTCDMKKWGDLEMEEGSEFQLRIRDWCGLFVSIHDDKVYLIHQTARDFLLASAVTTTLRPQWLLPFSVEAAMTILAEVCLTFLNFSDLSDKQKVYMDDLYYRDITSESDLEDIKPLSRYAAMYWLAHLREIVNVSETTQQLYDNFIRYSCQSSPFWLESWLFENGNHIRVHDFNELLSTRWTEIALKAFLGDMKGVHAEICKGRLARGAVKGTISPLFASIIGGNIGIAHLLLDNGSLMNDDSFTDTSVTEWICALSHNGSQRDTSGYKDLVERLINAKGQEILEDNILHRVADPDIVSILLQYGAKIDARNFYGQTPLHSHVGDPLVVKLLLAHRADPNATDPGGNTPLHMVWSEPRTVVLLVSAGCKVDAVNSLGCTALHTCLDSTVTEQLLVYGASVDIQDNAGRTPLMYRSELSNLHIAKLLLEAGANPNARDNDNMTPLHWMCSNQAIRDWASLGLLFIVREFPELVKLLVDSGANVDVQNVHGKTALHILCQNYSPDVDLPILDSFIKSLIDHGANTTIQDNDGQTPEDIAKMAHGDSQLVAAFFDNLRKSEDDRSDNELENALPSSENASEDSDAEGTHDQDDSDADASIQHTNSADERPDDDIPPQATEHLSESPRGPLPKRRKVL